MGRRVQVKDPERLIFDIFLTDQLEKGHLQIEYCPTEDMIGDYMTKPLQGEKFKKFRKSIMGEW